MKSEKGNPKSDSGNRDQPGNMPAHFPEDSHAPQSAGSPEPGADSHESSLVQSSIANSPSLGSGQQTDTMEVHKHPHHPAHRKKWGEYLLEFLMLFLAVFLGFIAENIREHYVEHQRAKQYAASLVSDLEQDTADLAIANERYFYSVNNIDTFLMLMTNNEVSGIPTGKLYWYGLWSGYNRSFVRNDATFQQMKSSGSLRYISNKTISNKLGLYDALVRKIERQNAEDLPFQLKTRELRGQLFDFKYNNAVNRLVLDSVDLKDYPRVDSFMRSNPPLVNSDKTLFNQFAEFCRVRARIFVILLRYQRQAQQLAKELIQDLKKEYHLEQDE